MPGILRSSLLLLAGTAVSATEVRQLADGSSYSGIQIMKNNSAIMFGTEGDVALKRSGEDTLSTDNTLMLQGFNVARGLQTFNVGGVAWDFAHPGTGNYFRTDGSITLPSHFTIEFWVYPKTSAAGDTVMSFTSADTDDCLKIVASGFPSTNEWHHVVVTYNRVVTTIHVNGVDRNSVLDGFFCGDYTGQLVFGQDAASIDGDFTFTSSANMLLDTVAIYSRAFDEVERGTTDKTCVDLDDRDLVSLWSGYTRGQDLIGPNSAEVRLNGFDAGAAPPGTCSAGNGQGTLGDDYSEYATSYVHPVVGAVGWVFPGSSTSYHLLVEDLTLPQDFSIEFWVLPTEDGSGTMFLSFATSNNNNCVFLNTGDLEVGEWSHVILTWDGEQQSVFLNGQMTTDTIATDYMFCGEYTGSLSIGQEQDSVSGGYSSTQAAPVIVDTVAIYRRALAWDEIDQGSTTPCIDMADPDLVHLYSGFTRGSDLLGNNDAEFLAAELVVDGDTTTVGATFGWTDFEVSMGTDASCPDALDMAEVAAPTFDNTLVGGIGWDFYGDSTEHFFGTAADFALPDEFTIEFWALPRKQQGFILSFAAASNKNCILMYNTKFPEYDVWYHILVVVDSDDNTAVYVNGEDMSDTILDDSFCGDREGALVLGQEQDAVLGGYVIGEDFDGIIDTVAIYSRAFSSSEIETDKAVGVDLQDFDLYALWSGFTRGMDLVGTNDATVILYQVAQGMPNSDSNVNTVSMISPQFVGGIGWDLPADQTSFMIKSDTNFYLPSGSWAIEQWVSLTSFDNSGYLHSFAVDSTDNCLITKMAGFSSDDVGVWSHLVVTYDDANDVLEIYKDGVKDSGFYWGAFCGTSGPGSLVIGQEQDSVGGGFDSGQNAKISIDTIAIYSTYFDDDRIAERSGSCVNLQDADLVSVYSGYTRGRDLVGNQDLTVAHSEWLEGAELDCSA